MIYIKFKIPKTDEDKIESNKESNLTNRKISLDKEKNPVMIMPDDRNYGYWTDNNLKKQHY